MNYYFLASPTDNASLTPTFHNPRASNADMSDGSGIPKTSEELRRQAVSKTSNTKAEETEPTPEPKTWAQ